MGISFYQAVRLVFFFVDVTSEIIYLLLGFTTNLSYFHEILFVEFRAQQFTETQFSIHFRSSVYSYWKIVNKSFPFASNSLASFYCNSWR